VHASIAQRHPSGPLGTLSVMGTSNRRKNLERLWIVVGVAYGVARVFIAYKTVKQYGVNIWAFGVIEIGGSFPYSLGIARLVENLVDHNREGAVRWGVLALICYAAPEAFILLTGDDMPVEVYVTIAIILTVLGTIAVLGIVRRVRTSRRVRTTPDPAGMYVEH
jgi:hypothetical protein